MRRITAVAAALALATIATLALSLPALAQDDDTRGGPYGMGHGYGMGPGHGMGHGYGMGGYGMGRGGWGGQMGALMAQLPADKREQLRSFHFATQRQMIAKRADLEQARLDLAQAMQAFPLDHKAALAAFAKLSQARQALFELRLTAMTQMQQIVGKELWEELHTGPGPGMGPGGGPGMAPGRAPGMGR
jgi:Spy/CpxP family protein refolding chaperone